MYDKFSPGRCYKLCYRVVRAKKSNSLIPCEGCIFNTLWTCPRVGKGYCPCIESNVIFVNP